jgi:hypothetical protein
MPRMPNRAFMLLLPALLFARPAQAGVRQIKFKAVVASVGDGDNVATPPACDADAVAPGSQCTRRAIQAANATGTRCISRP